MADDAPIHGGTEDTVYDTERALRVAAQRATDLAERYGEALLAIGAAVERYGNTPGITNRIRVILLGLDSAAFSTSRVDGSDA